LKWPTGNSYSGQFSRDKRSGYGVFKWIDGKMFEGIWVNGR